MLSLSGERISSLGSANSEERAVLLSQFANSDAKTLYDKLRPSDDWLCEPPADIIGLRSSVLCLMVKDEEDIILQNLEHHFCLGFRYFFIMDNNSSDQTADLIREFRISHEEARVFYSFDFVVGHYQAEKMNSLQAFVRRYLKYEKIGADWIFFVDADEFIGCGSRHLDQSVESFNKALKDPHCQLLYLHWVQCGSLELIKNTPRGFSPLEYFPCAWPSMAVSVSKVAFRLDANFEITQGNHNIKEYFHGLDNAQLAASFNFYLFHYPNRTIDQLRKKLINGHAALVSANIAANIENTADHWRTYYQWYIDHGDVALANIINGHIKTCKFG